MVNSVYRSITAAIAAGSIFGASAASAAPTLSYTALNPAVALSLFASSESLAAVCGIAASSALSAASTAAVTASAQTGPAQGCVLPVVDAVPVAVAPPPAIPLAVVPAGYSLSPLLIGLGAIAVGVGLFALFNRDKGNNGIVFTPPPGLPPFPISPA